ncbi:MAG: 4Fe-4S ferredoxin [Chloroflexi bacterium]|nr:4Fe-4S ferredoxin [Chloroflexota bacterium]
MEIDKRKCVGCGNCIPWCTMGVISIGADNKAEVNVDECVECSNCYRVLRGEGHHPRAVRLARRVLAAFGLRYDQPIDRCPTGALVPPKLTWPRTLRRAFSDPLAPHEHTGIGGRGTEEIKTNDVTGRLGPGDVGFVVELGRPGLGARFRDFERMAMELAKVGVAFEPMNPLTALMTDRATGRFREDVLDEKVLSAIIELKTTMDRVPAVLETIDRVQRELPTVVSVGIASKCNPDGSIPHETVVKDLSYKLSCNGKTNLGLGRPQSASAGRA